MTTSCISYMDVSATITETENCVIEIDIEWPQLSHVQLQELRRGTELQTFESNINVEITGDNAEDAAQAARMYLAEMELQLATLRKGLENVERYNSGGNHSLCRMDDDGLRGK